MADIAIEAASSSGVRLSDLRGGRQSPGISKARRVAFDAIRLERPDLTSQQVGLFFNVEGSTVRHAWRRLELEAA